MKITKIPFEIEFEDDPTRSKGVHLSDVRSFIAFDLGILDKKYEDEKPNNAVLALGLAWEEWIAKRHKAMLYQPGEVTVDGIHMTPDGLSLLNDGTAIINEFKTTRKSMKREDALDEEWLWLSQTKSYCSAYKTNVAWWHILWLNGDYKDNGVTAYRIYQFEFTNLEVKENWEMIVRTSRSDRFKKWINRRKNK